MLRYLPFLVILALWIYAFIDCLNTPENQVRGLPKIAWVFIILLFGEVLIGPVAWLVAGRPRREHAGGGAASPWPRGGRGAARKWVAPDDNPDFLRSLKDEGKKEEGEKKGGPKDEGEGRRDEALLKDWEADLRRREEELRRKENGSADGEGGNPPPKG
ncbi:PLD nuclease N-terminal domain-containing protein [Streptomyces paromomycinus]|uniref:Membrane protein n=1 Tax=Streptomyces paromomycinus TaxID=92743 RepID=A0A401W6A9_STREY|nr:PLD nuclease N-terminal domain-containing protein [Streptomyces paromomycinus]GCD44819.1 membrane protein [Streptomyces paromomycinus]